MKLDITAYEVENKLPNWLSPEMKKINREKKLAEIRAKHRAAHKEDWTKNAFARSKK